MNCPYLILWSGLEYKNAEVKAIIDKFANKTWDDSIPIFPSHLSKIAKRKGQWEQL